MTAPRARLTRELDVTDPTAQAAFELAKGGVERGVTVIGRRLGPDHGPAGDDGELDPLTSVGLTRVVLLGDLHVDPDDLGLQLLDLGEFGGHVAAEPIVDVRVTPFHDDVHLGTPSSRYSRAPGHEQPGFCSNSFVMPMPHMTRKK